MPTLSSFSNTCLEALNDSGSAVWSSAVVKDFIQTAIQDYNNYFNRLVSYTINCSAGDQDYDLPYDFTGMVSVEYPAGEDPPEYLSPRAFTHYLFWSQDGFYDVLRHGDATAPDELLLSNSPADGESIGLVYQGAHDDTLADSDPLTIPARHLPLLMHHVIYQAWRFLASAEMQSPTGYNPVMVGQLQENAAQMLAAYRAEVDTCLKHTATGGAAAAWEMDRYGQVYR